MISYRDGIIYIYKLRQNLNLIRFFKTFVKNNSKHSCRGYGDILGINNIKSSGLKRVYISKVYYKLLTKVVKYDTNLFEFDWAVQKSKVDLNNKMKRFIFKYLWDGFIVS